MWIQQERVQRERYPASMSYRRSTGSAARGRPRREWIDNSRDRCSNVGITLLQEAQLSPRDRAMRHVS